MKSVQMFLSNRLCMYGLIFCVIPRSCLATNLSNLTAEDFERLVSVVNAANSTWQADLSLLKSHPHFFSTMKLGFSLDLLLQGSNNPQLRMKLDVDEDNATLPEKFDLRKQYPECTNIGHIKFQSNCGSCWAVAATGALADRMCIATRGELNHPLSADHLLTCCKECVGNAGVCDGGNPIVAWRFFQKRGVPTGGDYASHQGCKPYRIAPCNYPGYPPCSHPDKPTVSLHCTGNRCSNPYFRTPFEDNLYYVSSYGAIYAPDPPEIINGTAESWTSTQEILIQRAIAKHGSVVAAIVIYQDFMLYRRGVYQHLVGDETGGHAVKLIGWGVRKGVKYWLGVNSWGRMWGEGGTFKIRRGVDECGVESMQVTGGIFDDQRSSDLIDFIYDTLPVESSSNRVGVVSLMRACLLLFSILFIVL